MQHFFTVDVEEYFQVSALAPYVERASWSRLDSRVVPSTMKLLELLEGTHQKATFFILGWIAERAPHLVKEIAASGHEVASHGWDHRKVTDETPAEFRESVHRSKEILQQIAGAAVQGYRAPSFSIVRGREWALDILQEEGYAYDSSLFPIRRPGYGYASAQRDPHLLQRAAGPLAEYPPATLRRFGLNLPAAGGAYLRLFPLQLIEHALNDAEQRGQPATIYIHPWELDPEQPRFATPLPTRIRHYGGLARTIPRLQRLFANYRFQAIADHLEQLSAPALNSA